MDITQKYINELTYKIIGCAIEVHKNVGHGLLESVYEKCLIKELTLQGLQCDSKKKNHLNYKGISLNFHCTNIFKEGQKTFVNELFAMLPKE